MSPVELIKVAQQCAGGVSSATMTTAPSSATVTVSMTRVAQNIGMLPALRCGLTATLLRDGIPHGVWFMSYEMCKDVLLSGKELSENFMPISVPLMSGAVAATVAWGVGCKYRWSLKESNRVFLFHSNLIAVIACSQTQPT
jgi:solute carrier family 25 carnitine/acylcarnitine transporter 20/29